ncbi:hypothetical protein, partial [Pseudomonas lopnurensis]|uniref:hypothetical protein n=1 Tax=Pseudomonas lopnurensis TaxID=1477517 RepID=UPI001A9CB5CE
MPAIAFDERNTRVGWKTAQRFPPDPMHANREQARSYTSARANTRPCGAGLPAIAFDGRNTRVGWKTAQRFPPDPVHANREQARARTSARANTLSCRSRLAGDHIRRT